MLCNLFDEIILRPHYNAVGVGVHQHADFRASVCIVYVGIGIRECFFAQQQFSRFDGASGKQTTATAIGGFLNRYRSHVRCVIEVRRLGLHCGNVHRIKVEAAVFLLLQSSISAGEFILAGLVCRILFQEKRERVVALVELSEAVERLRRTK